MRQSKSDKQVFLRKLTKVEAQEEEIYRRQLKESWCKRPGETWEEKYKREQAGNVNE